MFGNKAIKRWYVFSPKTNVEITRGHIKKLTGLNVEQHSSGLAEVVKTIRVVEENFKKCFHNTLRGVAWCRANTTLFHHRSAWCVACDFKDNCKETLKKEFPKIYVTRGYGETK
jgi:hypothetical protein